jgi:predicted ATPase
VSLVPQSMGAPVPQHRTGGQVRLNKEGANLADYLLNIRRLDQAVFDGIVETLQHVLPYAKDLQPSLTSELERTVYLQLSEANYKVPGWLLSTGTLRILAFLALFRHPSPPPLILIEELENGLDPRTLHLLVDEIRTLVESRRSQVIVTTHSPYLLDLLELSHIVMVERIAGQPTFTRPADQKALQRWARDFSPGRLYTMGLFNKKRGQ